MLKSYSTTVEATSAAPSDDAKMMAALAVLITSLLFAALLTSTFEHTIKPIEDKKTR
jgi:hypothetical protein